MRQFTNFLFQIQYFLLGLYFLLRLYFFVAVSFWRNFQFLQNIGWLKKINRLQNKTTGEIIYIDNKKNMSEIVYAVCLSASWCRQYASNEKHWMSQMCIKNTYSYNHNVIIIISKPSSWTILYIYWMFSNNHIMMIFFAWYLIK